MTTLDTLEVGLTATVRQVGGPRSFRCRLMEFGLLPGTKVRIVRRHPVQGILELEVRSSHLSLRTDEAGYLAVTR